MKYTTLSGLLLLALSFAISACDFDGGVEQGRCVGFNPEARTVTIVVDTTLDQHNPHYSGKVDTFKLPLEARDMGPAPEVGDRLMLEIDKNQLLYYDAATKGIREMPVQYTQIEKGIPPKSSKLKGMDFPIVDKNNRTVTVYSPNMEAIVTFRVPEAAIDLPLETWRAGDEVRIAFRNENRQQAIRLMNVTKTNIFTR